MSLSTFRVSWLSDRGRSASSHQTIPSPPLSTHPYHWGTPRGLSSFPPVPSLPGTWNSVPGKSSSTAEETTAGGTATHHTGRHRSLDPRARPPDTGAGTLSSGASPTVDRHPSPAPSVPDLVSLPSLTRQRPTTASGRRDPDPSTVPHPRVDHPRVLTQTARPIPSRSPPRHSTRVERGTRTTRRRRRSPASCDLLSSINPVEVRPVDRGGRSRRRLSSPRTGGGGL